MPLSGFVLAQRKDIAASTPFYPNQKRLTMASAPNIVFIHVDELHYQALSSLGNPYVSTPGLDQMAREGVLFTASYCASSSCSPARASWYTGCMPCEHGMITNDPSERILPELPDLGGWLRSQGGYRTFYGGKWHIGGRSPWDGFTFYADTGMGQIYDSMLTKLTVGLLDSYNEPAPFFLNVGFVNPHDCCYFAMKGGGRGKFALTESMLDQLPPLPPNYVDNPFYKRSDWTHDDFRFYIYTYYRLAEMVDEEVGRVYQTIKASRFRDNTLVIFSSDHGDGLGFHGKLSKGFLEEEGWRVPTIIVPPGKPKGGVRSGALVTATDIPSTICDYAGVPPIHPGGTGRSLRPLLENNGGTWRKYVFGESMLSLPVTGPVLAVRDARYKTIFGRNKVKQVYDLHADPLEQANLAEAHPGIAAGHLQALRSYLGARKLYRVPAAAKLTPAQKAVYANSLAWYSDILEGRYP